MRELNGKLQTLTSVTEDYRKSAKFLSAAWLGQEQPQSIKERLAEKAANINLNETKIEKLKTAIAELTEWQIGADFQYRSAQEAVESLDKDLSQIDRRITELRGF